MTELVRSRQAMVLVLVAAAIWALSDVLAGTAYATFSGPGDLQTLNNLVIAVEWLAFGAGLVALCGVAFVAWTLYLSRQWTPMWETAGAALSTLIFVIGLLVAALQAPDNSSAGNIIAAVGLGGWAVVVVVGAARRALLEQDTPQLPHQAALRLGAVASILLLAISIGLPSPTVNDAAPGIATGIMAALGYGGLILTLSLARNRGMISTRQLPIVILGLALLVLSGVAHAVGVGVVYGPPPYSILAVRIALSIPAFVEAMAFLLLAWAAFGRLAELSDIGGSHQSSATSAPPDSSTQQAEWPPSASASVPPSWQADPTRRHERRWWDGVRWTQHVIDNDQPAVDPLVSPDESIF